jgi:phosphate transport system ATP-binding protein
MVKIKTSNLNLHFGQNHVLKNVNLEIEEKKITAIIGPPDAENPLCCAPLTA